MNSLLASFTVLLSGGWWRVWIVRAMPQHHSDTLLLAGLALGFSRLAVIKKWPGLALVHSTAACNVIAQ